jgi:hypothetical protein
MSGSPRRTPGASSDAATDRRWTTASSEPSDTSVADMLNERLLLYTDGLIDARHRDGRMFTITGLGEFMEREAAAGQTAPETLRRLRHAIVDRQPGQLEDDATAVLVEWHRGAEADLLPRTAR